MVQERLICCCGASSWTICIAWLQIVGNIMLLIVSFIAMEVLPGVKIEDHPNKIPTVTLAISMIISLFGLIMGSILLKGTNQKRVGYLRTWFIYGIVTGLTSIISLILTAGNLHGASTFVFGGIIGIAIHAYFLSIVHIHMTEIKEGVFVRHHVIT